MNKSVYRDNNNNFTLSVILWLYSRTYMHAKLQVPPKELCLVQDRKRVQYILKPNIIILLLY